MTTRGGVMTKASRWIPRFAVVAVLLAFVVGPAFAQSAKFQFSQRNMKKMIKIIDKIQAGEGDAAQEMLEGINLKRAKPYGRARILQMLGSMAAEDEEFEKALEYMERCIAEEALQPEDQLRSLYLVGQLQTMLERYDDALITLESWIAQVEVPAPASYYVLAVTYYRAERPDDALDAIKKAVNT